MDRLFKSYQVDFNPTFKFWIFIWLYSACLYNKYSAILFSLLRMLKVPFCPFLHISFCSTTSTPVLAADQTSAFPLPQFCPAQWLTACASSVPAFCHFHPCAMLPNSHPGTLTACGCLALSPPRFKTLCPLPFLCFPRWALQRVLQREWVTELLSLQGMEQQSSAAASCGDCFFFSSFRNECSVVSEDTSAHYLKRSPRLLLLERCKIR